MMERQLTHSITPPMSISTLRLTDQVARNNIAQESVRYLYDHMHSRIQAC